MLFTHRSLLIQPNGFSHRLDWIATGQQDNHVRHNCRVTAQPVEHRTFGSCKGFLTDLAKTSSVLLIMYT